MESVELEGKHVLIFPFPAQQGHLNPLVQVAKRLANKGLQPFIAITRYTAKSMPITHVGPVIVEYISDGYDDHGFPGADNVHAYLKTLRTVGSRTLSELIDHHKELGHNISCLVYDSHLPWALDVAKEKGLYAAAFFTQSCAVDAIYYHEYHKKLPSKEADDQGSTCAISLPGLPPLEVQDLPSFISVPGSYPGYLKVAVSQFSNIKKADCVLINTFNKLETEELKWMSGLHPTKAIGPTVPSMYLDKRLEDDKDYGLNLRKPNGEICMNWLNTQESSSVVYVSLGSLAILDVEQMEELARGLNESGHPFLWVVRETEEKKLPPEFSTTNGRLESLIVRWAPQLEVLAHPAVGCFLTHCGWNSTLEALCMGVPMVGIPLWTDQPTNAKYVEDVWRVGVRVKVDEKGFVVREEIVKCIKKVTEEEEIRESARKWKELAIDAVSEGGSSDRSIDEFVKEICHRTHKDSSLIYKNN